MAKVFSFSFILSCILLSACQSSGSEKLTIAAAANTQFALEELARKFTETTGIACETIFGSSGKLTAQIMEGAPFDVFISADMNYPEQLFKTGHGIAAPEVYAYGRLILWSLSDGWDRSDSAGKPEATLARSSQASLARNQQAFVNMLTRPEINHIALANPKTAPYGVAAVEALKHYGIYDEVEEKLTYGESISQTNHFIISKAVVAGFTSLSVIEAPEFQEMGHWEIVDTAAYSPIAQGAVLLKSSKKKAGQAQKFYDFLFSEQGKRILSESGYIIIDND